MHFPLLQPGVLSYFCAVGACLLATLLALPVRDFFNLANIVMLFLLAVLLVARHCGRGPAVLAAFLSVAFFDFFFVPPQFTFAVNDAQYLVTFVVMLSTALVTGTLTASLRRETEAAKASEARTQALHGMAKELAGAMSVERVVESIRTFISQAVGAEAALLQLDSEEKLRVVSGGNPAVQLEMARWALSQTVPVQGDVGEPDGKVAVYFALQAPTRQRGVLAVVAPSGELEHLRQQDALIKAAASLVAIALERLHYVDAAHAAEVGAAAERLRSSLLSALSHDLRTPLTAMRGMAETLALAHGDPQELALALRDQAVRLSRMVENLLDMARLQAGRVVLRKEWQPLEEVVGSSLKLLNAALEGRAVRLALTPDLPLLEFDAVLIERVLCNLIENAAKYSPSGTPITIGAAIVGGFLEIQVCDQGGGFPAGREQAVFELFERGVPESTQAGVGLGLAICRAIVEAHGGKMAAATLADGGAMVSFTLPLGAPPPFDEEKDEQ